MSVLSSALAAKAAIKMNSIDELVHDIKQGRMVILLDDEDRENEGDLIMAAEHITPEAVNFMAKLGRGLICLPMSQQRGEQLGLPLMVQENHSPFATNFTVSIEAAKGVTTGISAADRACTIAAAAAKKATSADIISPGHIFPLLAQSGGVLSRAGHTEAVVDLVKMADCGESGVLVEILNDDGTMARRDDCLRFATEHGLKIGTIADLIHYRLMHEQTIEPLLSRPLQNRFGAWQLTVFQDAFEQSQHIALVKGQIQPEQAAVVRVHSLDLCADVLAIDALADSWQLGDAMQAIQQADSGVLLLLGKRQSAEEILAKLQGEGSNKTVDTRHVGVGSQILKALGLKKMHLLSNTKQFYALSGFDLEVVNTYRAEEKINL